MTKPRINPGMAAFLRASGLQKQLEARITELETALDLILRLPMRSALTPHPGVTQVQNDKQDPLNVVAVVLMGKDGRALHFPVEPARTVVLPRDGQLTLRIDIIGSTAWIIE